MPSETRPRKLPRVAGWVKLAGRSFGVAALVGAAQLGAAQALALLVSSTVPRLYVWRPPPPAPAPPHRGSTPARKRAVANARSKTVDPARGVVAGATRVGATVFAALGAAASFALVWLPGRNAYAPEDVRVLAMSAGIGIGVGAILSLLSLTAAPIAANVGVW